MSKVPDMRSLFLLICVLLAAVCLSKQFNMDFAGDEMPVEFLEEVIFECVPNGQSLAGL